MPKTEVPHTSSSSGKEVAGNSDTSVRLSEYSGLEVKTLWNHFNKDSLITSTELGALLERILIKDATDLLADLKKSSSWRKYASKVLGAMDTSKGETLDLSEFSEQFNRINQRRFYYFLRYLYPDLLKHIRDVCEQMGLTEGEMKDLDNFLSGREEVQVAEIVEEDSSDKDEIKRLNALLVQLQNKVRELEAMNADERNNLEAKHKGDSARLSSDLNRLELENERLRQALSAREQEDQNLAETQTKWKEDFDRIISENDELRNAVSQAKTDIDSLNNEVLRVSTELNEELNRSGKDVFKFTGTGLTGIDLDPLRTELVRRFGSIDAFIASLGKKNSEKRGITLNELELLGVSMGYSREYCKKLFYSLDTNDRGIVSISQFGRPFPVINKELCLLTKGDLKINKD